MAAVVEGTRGRQIASMLARCSLPSSGPGWWRAAYPLAWLGGWRAASPVAGCGGQPPQWCGGCDIPTTFLDADLCMFDVSVLLDEWMMVRGC
uniref:Uncharacterized protein n=1 Tax=Oryza meridionalis TaxID=40149 RepID=A0A0E0FAY9_9ORYZ